MPGKKASLLQKQSAKVHTISTETCSITDAVGPTLYVDLSIGSVLVQAHHHLSCFVTQDW